MSSLSMPVRNKGGQIIGTARMSEWEPKKITLELDEPYVREVVYIAERDWTRGLILEVDSIPAVRGVVEL